MRAADRLGSLSCLPDAGHRSGVHGGILHDRAYCARLSAVHAQLKVVIRIAGIAALTAFSLARVWACLLGLAHAFGATWAIVIAATLLLLRLLPLLQIAALCGAVVVWHWPV